MVHFDFVATPQKWWLMRCEGALSHGHQRGCWNVPECQLVRMLIWITLRELLLRVESHTASIGKRQVKQTFLNQIASLVSKVHLQKMACQVSWTNYFRFEVLQLVKNLTSYWFPMAFQKGRTLLIHHMKNLWYDIIRSWRQSKSRFQIPLLQNVYLSDLICWWCSDVCNFLQGRLLECEDMAVMKKICMVGEPQTWVFELDLVKSTQCQH